MEIGTLPTSDKEYWEHVYNHKQICEALLDEGSHVAKNLFHIKIHHIHSMHGPVGNETAYILLTSLNRSLYDYFVIQLNLSFTKCCYDNRAHTHDVSDVPSLLAAGDRIIDAYTDCMAESRESYSHIEMICSYIKAHLSDDLSLSKLSSEVFQSKNHLCTTFKNLTGTNFCDYIRQLRIQRARVLLRTTNQSIDEIAALCGFNSSTYFSTVFKAEMGVSPSAFRNEVRR